MPVRRYLILIEGNPCAGFSAHAPDLPGCVAAAQSRADVESEMHHAIAFHLEGLQAAGEPIPEPSGLTATYIRVAA